MYNRILSLAARLCGTLLGLAWGLAISNAALAQSNRPSLSIAAFHGCWNGTALSENENSIYFQLTARDLNVAIQPTGPDSFSVSWTTVTRQKGDPRNPTVNKKTQSISFVPSGRTNFWKQDGQFNPVEMPFAWANIQGQTLTVTNLVINDNGSFEFQVYKRTLTGTAMDLTFTRIIDGEKQRDAKGRLVKVANECKP